MVQAGGEDMIRVLLIICNKIWQTGEWPTQWTQSLVITLPKKGNLQLCQNYRTISLISYPSKVMLKTLLTRLKPEAEKIIAEEQAAQDEAPQSRSLTWGYCVRDTFNTNKIYTTSSLTSRRRSTGWHEALWATMRLYNININLITMIQKLYEKATSAVCFNNSIGDWFKTSVGVRQGCLLSPTLFNILLERIMTDALEDHAGIVSIGGRTITNLSFADDIDGLAGTETELANW